MGIKLLTGSHYAYSTFYGEMGILDSIKIGGGKFMNVLVFVSDLDNLLGLDLISKLGRLKITRKTLMLNPAPAAAISYKFYPGFTIPPSWVSGK